MITIIICGAVIYGICAIVRAVVKQSKEKARQEEIKRIQLEQAKQRAMWINARYAEQQRERQIAAVTKEQERQAKEQARLAKEQEKQAEVLRKHEEQIMKLDHRMVAAETEIAFNREQRERLFSLLDIEERERDAAIEGSTTWQKHQKKIISLESQIHTVQKRIDRANMDKALCKQKIGA